MLSTRTTSTSLLSRVRDPGDHTAWREFDGRYRELMLRFCKRRGMSHVDAEDVVQRVFTSLSQALRTFQYDPGRGRFRDFLFRCVRNCISDWSRSPDRRRAAVEIGAAEVDSLVPSRDENEAWEREWVDHHYRLAIESIRGTFEARTVALFDQMMAGATVAELAGKYGMTEEAVAKTRQRVRTRMEELIAQQIADEDK